MRRTTERRLLPLAAVAFTTWAAGCHHADSILLVEVAGDLGLMPASFAVHVSAGQSGTRDIRVAPASGDPVSLPASFTIELPGSVTGPVSVTVQALDASSNYLGVGTATQQNLDVGGQTILVVTLVAPGSVAVTTPPDAGGAGVDAQAPRDAAPDGGAGDAGNPDAHPPDGGTPTDAGGAS